MEEYTHPKNWEDLVGHFFDPDNKAAKHLLEYAPDPVIIQILLNIPHDKLETFCLINTRVRRICKSGLVKKQYYEKNPILETDSYEKAKAFLKKNPKGLLLITKDNDFNRENFNELANNIVHLELYSNTKHYLGDTRFPNLKTWKFYYPNSNLLHEKRHYKDKKLNGLYREWYENGKLWEECNYKDGKRDGLYRAWHENGQLEEESNFKDGKEDGLYRLWYENGQLKEEYNYKDGALNGLSRDWYRNGQLKEECNVKNNIRDGLCSFWNEEGNLVKQIDYKDGEPSQEFEMVNDEEDM